MDNKANNELRVKAFKNELRSINSLFNEFDYLKTQLMFARNKFEGYQGVKYGEDVRIQPNPLLEDRRTYWQEQIDEINKQCEIIRFRIDKTRLVLSRMDKRIKIIVTEIYIDNRNFRQTAYDYGYSTRQLQRMINNAILDALNKTKLKFDEDK